MIHRRNYIREGATTTAGGIVKASSQWQIVNGAALAREGDPVDCPACGTQGMIKCAMPRISDRFEGKEYALSDDLCICRCNPPPKLLAEQDFKRQIFVVASAESPEEAAARAVSATTAAAFAFGATYDERPRLIAPLVEGVPFHIETLDGRTFSGRIGADGLLPRIATQGEAEYTVAWGDEALAKMKQG